MALSSVPRAERNPRLHDLARIRSSMAAYGCTVAGILDERTGRLVAGHGRLAALEEMSKDGAAPPDGVLDNDGEWLVPIVRGWASANDEEAQGYLITDNRLPELGGWDERELAEILDGVADYNLDLLDIAGYDPADIDQLLLTTGTFAERTTGYFGSIEDEPDDEEDDDEEDEDDVDTDARSDGVRPDDAAEFVQVSWIVNSDQRKTIRKALARAQKLFNLDTSAIALCAVAERFLAAHPEDEKEAAA